MVKTDLKMQSDQSGACHGSSRGSGYNFHRMEKQRQHSGLSGQYTLRLSSETGVKKQCKGLWLWCRS